MPELAALPHDLLEHLDRTSRSAPTLLVGAAMAAERRSTVNSTPRNGDQQSAYLNVRSSNLTASVIQLLPDCAANAERGQSVSEMVDESTPIADQCD